jgi:protein-tyrosine phosphatase
VTAQPRFDVLVVCTANVCRSPYVERLLRDRLSALDGGARVHVSSAGLRALTTASFDPVMAERLGGLGIATDGPVGRPLDAAALRSADLVLTMTRAHRSAIVGQAPAVLRRTFTLRELARIARAVRSRGGAPAPGPTGEDAPTDDVVARLRALVVAAPALRGPTAPPDPRQDDVDDPYRGPQEGYRRAVAEIDDAVLAIVAALARDEPARR